MRVFGAYDAFPKGSRWLRFTKITVVIGEPLYFDGDEVKTKRVPTAIDGGRGRARS